MRKFLALLALLIPCEAGACAYWEPPKLNEVVSAEIVIVGIVQGYEAVSPFRAELAIRVTDALQGDISAYMTGGTIKVIWVNSDGRLPASGNVGQYPTRYIFPLHSPRSNALPENITDWSDASLLLVQGPCSVANVYAVDSARGFSLYQILKAPEAERPALLERFAADLGALGLSTPPSSPSPHFPPLNNLRD